MAISEAAPPAPEPQPAGLAGVAHLPGRVEISVVMPCLNEAETVGTCVTKALDALLAMGVPGEVIVADNGSTDGSQALAQACGATVVAVADRGYGAALMGGIAAARGEFIILGDSDDSYDFTGLAPFVEKLREGHDLVMGNRFRGGIQPGAMPALHRYLGTPVLTALERVFFKSPVGDVNCGLRGLRASAVRRLDLRATGMEFASEMVVKASLQGLRIVEVPTTLSPGGRTRAPHLRSWRDGWRHLRFLLLYSPRWLFLYPGSLLMFLGAAACAWLLPGPRTVGHVTFDIQTLLVAAIVIVIGFQSVIFSVFTKFFAIAEGLLPEDPRLGRLLEYVNLELGLAVGATLCVAGVAGTAYALLHWSYAAFGALNASRSLRIVIPSVTALTMGSQIVLSSFFLSVLGLRRRRPETLVAD